MSQEPNKAPLPNCRQQLAADGKPDPRSSCAVCGRFSPRWKECDALLAAAPVPPAGGVVEVIKVQYRVSAGPQTGWSFWGEGNGDEFRNSYQVEVRELVDRAHVTRLQAENAALQQRLNVADQRVDELNTALETCGRWFAKHSPTAPLIGGFGEAEHPMITLIRGAQSVPAAKVDCGNCAFVDGVCSTGCETQRIRAAQQ